MQRDVKVSIFNQKSLPQALNLISLKLVPIPENQLWYHEKGIKQTRKESLEAEESDESMRCDINYADSNEVEEDNVENTCINVDDDEEHSEGGEDVAYSL